MQINIPDMPKVKTVIPHLYFWADSSPNINLFLAKIGLEIIKKNNIDIIVMASAVFDRNSLDEFLVSTRITPLIQKIIDGTNTSA